MEEEPSRRPEEEGGGAPPPPPPSPAPTGGRRGGRLRIQLSQLERALQRNSMTLAGVYVVETPCPGDPTRRERSVVFVECRTTHWDAFLISVPPRFEMKCDLQAPMAKLAVASSEADLTRQDVAVPLGATNQRREEEVRSSATLRALRRRAAQLDAGLVVFTSGGCLEYGSAAPRGPPVRMFRDLRYDGDPRAARDPSLPLPTKYTSLEAHAGELFTRAGLDTPIVTAEHMRRMRVVDPHPPGTPRPASHILIVLRDRDGEVIDPLAGAGAELTKLSELAACNTTPPEVYTAPPIDWGSRVGNVMLTYDVLTIFSYISAHAGEGERREVVDRIAALNGHITTTAQEFRHERLAAIRATLERALGRIEVQVKKVTDEEEGKWRQRERMRTIWEKARAAARLTPGPREGRTKRALHVFKERRNEARALAARAYQSLRELDQQVWLLRDNANRILSGYVALINAVAPEGSSLRDPGRNEAAVPSELHARWDAEDAPRALPPAPPGATAADARTLLAVQHAAQKEEAAADARARAEQKRAQRLARRERKVRRRERKVRKRERAAVAAAAAAPAGGHGAPAPPPLSPPEGEGGDAGGAPGMPPSAPSTPEVPPPPSTGVTPVPSVRPGGAPTWGAPLVLGDDDSDASSRGATPGTDQRVTPLPYRMETAAQSPPPLTGTGAFLAAAGVLQN